MSARQLRRHLANPGAAVVVAILDREISGAAVVFFHSSHRIARLYSIAVAAQARGFGIGERLLKAAERIAQARKSAALRLEVRGDNAAAQRLYERRGYRRFGTRKHYYEDGRDALRYEKSFARARPAAGRCVSPSRP
jgi:ribosomal protein S18 acetylase RimI-like enzyme